MGNLYFAPFALTIALSLIPQKTQDESFSRWILWNVGQGQFLTLSLPDTCWHFDLGGEKAPWSDIIRECGAKLNLILLSHWDWDHLSLLKSATRNLPHLCIQKEPNGPSTSQRKKKLIHDLSSCPIRPKSWRELSWPSPSITQKPRKKTSNEWSRVFYDWHRQMLIPGDSPSTQEKTWALQNFSLISSTRVLVLGHHGSQTSTSQILLDHLPHLRMGLVSARMRRYGHPHPKVVARLRQKGIPIVPTELWGHIVLPIRPVPTPPTKRLVQTTPRSQFNH